MQTANAKKAPVMCPLAEAYITGYTDQNAPAGAQRQRHKNAAQGAAYALGAEAAKAVALAPMGGQNVALHKAGATAARAGLPLAANPFCPGTTQSVMWAKGHGYAVALARHSNANGGHANANC